MTNKDVKHIKSELDCICVKCIGLVENTELDILINSIPETHRKSLPSSISLERDDLSSNNNERNFLRLEKIGFKGKEKRFEGDSVTDSITKYYGLSHNDTTIIKELYVLSKYPEIVNLIGELKCFTFNYLCFLLDRADRDRTVKRILSILIKRKIVRKKAFTGKSKRTFTLFIYLTPDAMQIHVDDTLREYIVDDEARHLKDLQRKKKKQTPKEVMEYNEEVRKEALRLKKENLDKGKCCNFEVKGGPYGVFQQHSCGKGVVKV